ncbi:hypothetical protein HKX48_009458, partial [Thoreauomyces humboldtii]
MTCDTSPSSARVNDMIGILSLPPKVILRIAGLGSDRRTFAQYQLGLAVSQTLRQTCRKLAAFITPDLQVQRFQDYRTFSETKNPAWLNRAHRRYDNVPCTCPKENDVSPADPYAEDPDYKHPASIKLLSCPTHANTSSCFLNGRLIRVVACGSLSLLEAFERAGAFNPVSVHLFLPEAVTTGDLQYCEAVTELFSRIARADMTIGFCDAALLAVKRRNLPVAMHFCSLVRDCTSTTLSYHDLPQHRRLCAAIYRAGWEQCHEILGSSVAVYRRLDDRSDRIRQCPMYHCGQGGHARLARFLVDEGGWTEDEVFLGLAGASISGDLETAKIYLDAIAPILERRAREFSAAETRTEDDFFRTPTQYKPKPDLELFDVNTLHAFP